MQPVLALGCGVVLAAVCYHFATPIASTPPAEPPTNPGHLALVVEGTVQSLAITHAIAKTEPWGGIPTGLKSPFTLRIDGPDGSLFASIPVDLSRFDTDPSHIGKPLVVTGCEVRDTRIALLVNIPDHPTAARYTFVHGDQTLGELSGERLRAMLAGGGR